MKYSIDWPLKILKYHKNKSFKVIANWNHKKHVFLDSIELFNGFIDQ